MLQWFSLPATELCFDFHLVTEYEGNPFLAPIGFATYWLLREPWEAGVIPEWLYLG
jgi:hypothetical protein